MKPFRLLTIACLSLCCACTRAPVTAPVTPAPGNQSVATTNPEPESDGEDHSEQPLRHAVFFSFKESSSEADVQSVVDAFRALPAKIEAITDFQSGVNNSPEGLDDGFTHCFLVTFDDEAGREVYLPHPSHKEFGGIVRPNVEKVLVFDFVSKD